MIMSMPRLGFIELDHLLSLFLDCFSLFQYGLLQDGQTFTSSFRGIHLCAHRLQCNFLIILCSFGGLILWKESCIPPYTYYISTVY